MGKTRKQLKPTAEQLKVWESMSIKVLAESGAMYPMRLKKTEKRWDTIPLNFLAQSLTAHPDPSV